MDNKQAILGFAEFFKGITGNQNLEIPSEIAEKCGIQAQAEKTCDIEKSNFDMRQYKLDTDTAYECGYNAGLKAQADGDYINRILKRMWNWRSKNTTSIDKVAMEMILREELPSVAMPTNGEYILKSEAIKTIQQHGVGCFDADEFTPEQCERYVIKLLQDLKPIER